MKRSKRPKIKMLFIMLLFTVVMNGCGNDDSAELTAEIEDDAVGAKNKTDTDKKVEKDLAASAYNVGFDEFLVESLESSVAAM